jgi:hypothetical protein
MHVDTEISYHSGDPPGAPIFEGCIGDRPEGEAATIRMSSRKTAALAEEEIVSSPWPTAEVAQ